MTNMHEAKALRWLAQQFPFVKQPKNDVDKMQNCIHVYASKGAEALDRLVSRAQSMTHLDHFEVVHEIGPYQADEILIYNKEIISREKALEVASAGIFHPAVMLVTKEQWEYIFNYKPV